MNKGCTLSCDSESSFEFIASKDHQSLLYLSSLSDTLANLQVESPRKALCKFKAKKDKALFEIDESSLVFRKMVVNQTQTDSANSQISQSTSEPSSKIPESASSNSLCNLVFHNFFKTRVLIFTFCCIGSFLLLILTSKL